MRTSSAHRYALSWLMFVLFAAIADTSYGGKFNPTLNIGDMAPTWKDLAGVDGKMHSSDELKDSSAVVVVFTCNSCPTAVDYEDRMMTLVKQFSASGKLALVAINSNRVAEDQMPVMQERAMARKFNYLYLKDETQAVAKAFGASYTPEFFVLDKDRKIVYMGAMDDNTDAAAVKSKYVEEAVIATLNGKLPASTETPARGCAVRYTRDRKKQ